MYNTALTRDERLADESDKLVHSVAPDKEIRTQAVQAQNSFNTHTVDDRFAQMHLNTDLVEEAKLAAKQKQQKSALTASRLRSQQEEAQEIRNSDQMLFGEKSSNSGGNSSANQSANDIKSQQKQAMINEFMISQSAMQCSVVDMQRDPSFSLATNQNEIFVQNRTPGREHLGDVNASTIEL